MSGFGADQGTGAAVVAVLRSAGGPGEARPIRGGGWTAERNRKRGAGEDCRRLIEHLTEGVGGVRSMRRAERSQRDMQLAIGDADVARTGEQLMQQGSTLWSDTGVGRSQKRKQIAVGLIGDHLDDVGQVLAFRGELDHGRLVEVADFDALGNVAALLEELRYASAGFSQLLAEPAMGDLEAPHGRPTLFGVVRGGGTVFAFELGEIGAGRMDLLIQSAALRIGDGAGRVLRLDLVIDECIEQELFSHVLEEVLLSPALEHAVGDLNVAQVPSTRDHLRLMAVVAQARDLP